MLILSRRSHEAIVVRGSNGFEPLFEVTAIDLRNGVVMLGIKARSDLPVQRSEVRERICPGELLRDTAGRPGHITR